MKANGDAELSEVPRLMERGQIKDLLMARGALLDAAEEMVSTVASEGRAMKPDEQRRFDLCGLQIREISGRLAEYRRAREADCASNPDTGGMTVNLPF